ncbi:hypothetical protein [Streptomyces vinaceus]|uniref:hypothetical protein n=1 Tax=Streptomyces vinaceus TaxID=1960 RepID=UPI0035DE7466
MQRQHTAAVLLAATTLLALTGCSSDPARTDGPAVPAAVGSSGTVTVDTSRADLEKAVRAYSAAYIKLDAAAAYASLSKRCQGKAGSAEMFARAVSNSPTLYGKEEIQTVTIDQLTGDLARVSYTYSGSKPSQSGQPWVREEGAWKYDHC